MHLAAESSRLDIVVYVLKNWDTNIITVKDEDGWMALYPAAAYDRVDIVACLVEKIMSIHAIIVKEKGG